MSDSLVTACAHCGAKNRLPAAKLAAAGGAKCGRCGQPVFTGAPVALDAARFDGFVSGDIPVLVDFWAAWCGPCRALAPILERAARTLEPHLPVAKLDVDAAPEPAQRFRVQAIPTLVVVRGGRELARTSGVMDEAALTAWARKAAGL